MADSRCTLRCLHTDCTGQRAHCRSGYIGATVSSTGVGLQKHARGQAHVWLCDRFLVDSTDLSQRPTRVARVDRARLASTHRVRMGDVFTRGFNMLPVFLHTADTLPAERPFPSPWNPSQRPDLTTSFVHTMGTPTSCARVRQQSMRAVQQQMPSFSWSQIC